MLEAEQKLLDAFNARWPNQERHRLKRLSKEHPTAHVAWDGGTYTLCGVRIFQFFAHLPDESTRMCDRCRLWLDRVSKGAELSTPSVDKGG